METAGWYRWFAEHEARGSSPQYERLATAVAQSDVALDWLARLPAPKRQPNLFFAATRHLGGPVEDPEAFFEFVAEHSAEVASLMATRPTQTNEAARCAAFLPALGRRHKPLALIEVGASAGLCLHLDRYAYVYQPGGTTIGASELTFAVDTAGPVPIPTELPQVVWRAGLDLHPLDVTSDDDLAWLRACVWPEHRQRRDRLDAASAIAREHPVRIDSGDLLTGTIGLIDDAPPDALKVVFHSAVLAYVDEAGRAAFAALMADIVDARDDVLWLSNEGPAVVPGLHGRGHSPSFGGASSFFHLGRNGVDLLALTDPHGAWLTWLDPGVDVVD